MSKQKQLENRLEFTKDSVERNLLAKEVARLRKLHNRVLNETKNSKKESKLRQSNGKQVFISQYVVFSLFGKFVRLTLSTDAKQRWRL
jgi:hypothetical protein